MTDLDNLLVNGQLLTSVGVDSSTSAAQMDGTVQSQIEHTATVKKSRQALLLHLLERGRNWLEY